ncbi:MAG: AmmeMemoRadiSam system protein B [Pseudomonadota bacterium]
MQAIRPAAVAGAFYPGLAADLRRQIKDYLAEATGQAPGQDTWPKALIVPHAGYIYSGPVAAAAYARLAPARGQVRRVVLLGPVHRVPVRGLALPEASGLETPLGIVPVDAEATRAIADLPQVQRNAAAHAWEHALEVQLPFLQVVLGDFQVLPLAVGSARPAEVAEVLERVWGGPETVILVSSDLSHYLPYPTARQVDGQTAQSILALHGGLSHEEACGATPVNGLLLSASQRRLRPELLDLRNSGDTAGPRDQVVGYGAFAFYEDEEKA